MIKKIKQQQKGLQSNQGHKKVLAKLHSLKVGAFKPLHQETSDELGSDYSIERLTIDNIPGSTILWEVTPRPSNCADVRTFFCLHVPSIN
jgi:hypothetical protein